jgi:hypothetical protein
MEAGTRLTDVSAVCPIPCINIFLGVGEGKDVVGVMDGGGHHANRRVRGLSNTMHKHILRVGERKGMVGVMDGGGHHTPSPQRLHCERPRPVPLKLLNFDFNADLDPAFYSNGGTFSSS